MKGKGRLGSFSLLIILTVLLNGCGAFGPRAGEATETPRVVEIAVLATPTQSATVPPSPTSTTAPSITPSIAATPLPAATRTSTRTRTATRSRTPTNTAVPQATRVSGPEQICAELIAQGRNELYILFMEPMPELVWDYNPRLFRTGICNSVLPPAVPQGRYRAFIYFPGSKHGRAESKPTAATLKPGLNVVDIGPWIPGLENHRAACMDRPIGEIEIEYDGSGWFRTVQWADGKTRIAIPIKCGGDYA